MVIHRHGETPAWEDDRSIL